MKRWKAGLVLDVERRQTVGMSESPTGEFVLYSDVAPLVEACRNIQSRIAEGVEVDAEEWDQFDRALSALDADGSKS
jgi:hypothetical protein